MADWKLGARQLQTGWWAYLIAFALVLIAALASEGWYWLLSHHRNLGMPFIIALVVAGAWGGMRPALAAAALAFLLYRYLLTEPFYNLAIDTGDALPLGTFLLTAVLVGVLAGQLRDRAHSAADRLRRLTILFAASRDLSAAANRPEVAKRLAQHLKAGVGFESAVWSAENGKRALLAQTDDMIPESRVADLKSEQTRTSAGAFYSLPLKTARGEVGSISLWSPDARVSKDSRDSVEALAQLGAIALDRAGLAAEISEARLVAEREGLRTALLSSLSHDLRTPIATILASASSLSDQGEQFDAATRKELLETIQDQADRLNRYVANLLDMTRLETGVLLVKRALVDPAEAMSSAVERTRRRLQGLRIGRSFTASDVAILVDPILLEQALVNILENAAAFSAPGSAIHVGVRSEAGEVVMSVADEGPGIAPEELPRIFDKFFRGKTDRERHAGVGLGLAVVRGVIESFGGRVCAESPAVNGRGACFSIKLPAHDALEPVW